MRVIVRKMYLRHNGRRDRNVSEHAFKLSIISPIMSRGASEKDIVMGSKKLPCDSHERGIQIRGFAHR